MPRSLKPDWIHVAKLTIDLMKTGRLYFADGLREGSARDVLLFMAIYIGHAEMRPMSAHKIAQYLGMPRATAVRRLEEMRDCGFVQKLPGGLWCIDLDAVGSRSRLVKMLGDNLAHIHMAASKLTKMDS